MVRYRKFWRESNFKHVWVWHAYGQTYMLTQRSPVEIRTPAHGDWIGHSKPLRHLCCRPAVYFCQLGLIVLTGGLGFFFVLQNSKVPVHRSALCFRESQQEPPFVMAQDTFASQLYSVRRTSIFWEILIKGETIHQTSSIDLLVIMTTLLFSRSNFQAVLYIKIFKVTVYKLHATILPTNIQRRETA